ncbi:MAG: hypothetical protein SZ59_C0003G0012 [candidate division TM6 bacterium GW2011_GWF2_28_16]|nr:MAG: hypothetical protein SZ59_C0003G0012 [candidate division TM6 bacterium GW2011_GWF2_28_16]
MYKNKNLIFTCLVLIFFSSFKNINSHEIDSHLTEDLATLSYEQLKLMADKAEQVARILKSEKEIKSLNNLEKVSVENRITWLSKIKDSVLFNNILFDGIGLGIKELLKTTVVTTGRYAIQYLVLFYFISKYVGIPMSDLVKIALTFVLPSGNYTSDEISRISIKSFIKNWYFDKFKAQCYIDSPEAFKLDNGTKGIADFWNKGVLNPFKKLLWNE